MTITSTMLLDTLNMFAFLAVELTLLFLLISYAVGILQEYIPPHKIQHLLSSKNAKGYILAAVLGAITPFCSCSTIPFLKGLIRAKASFGTMMVFLFASPLLNPIIIGLFAVTFGLQVTLFYFTVALGVSIITGYLLEKFGLEKYIKAQAYFAPSGNTCTSNCTSDCPPASQPVNKWLRVWHSTWADFIKALPYIVLGVSLGSIIYGFMPAQFISAVASEENPFAVPVAAVVGIPLYIRAEAVIPLSAALVEKGMGLGAVMALIIGSAGASLTEIILLKSIFKNQMIIAFVSVILSMAVGAGYLYSVIF